MASTQKYVYFWNVKIFKNNIFGENRFVKENENEKSFEIF
jgi:hypothetical protein